MSIPRPDPTEFAHFYAGYVDAVPDGDLLDRLHDQAHATQLLLRGLSDRDGRFRYAEGKWSVKEVLGHVTDAERIFGYRALRFARNDGTELPGFEQDAYIAAAHFEERSLASLLNEFAAVREATLRLFESFTEEELLRGGPAAGHLVTVRALAWIIAGHERHHQRVLRERYLGAREAVEGS